MYCSKCGEPNDDSAKFCIKCGAQLLTLSRPGARPAAPAPSSGTWQGPAMPPQVGAAQTGRKISPGSWVSVVGAIAVLILFFVPWAWSWGGEASGLDYVAEPDGELLWVVVTPVCAVAALGILYLFRKQLVVSAWARIAAAIGGLIPLIVMYIEYQDRMTIKWGYIGTVVGLALLIVGSVLDLLPASRQEPI